MDAGDPTIMHANDDHLATSDALRCHPADLESVRAWLLVELIEDDVDHGPLLADLAVCDHRIARHRIRPRRTRTILRTLG